MRDKIELGSTPIDEQCQQVGQASFDSRKDKLERVAFINQMKRVMGTPPNTAYFTTTVNSHDFGTYREVAISFNDNDEKECEYAFSAEENTPLLWDEEALKELSTNGYFDNTL